MASPSPGTDVLTIGETMVLLWPAAGETLEQATLFARSSGGAESNVAIALARLGHSVRWVSRLGDGPFGRSIRATLEREGVRVDAAIDPRAPTAVFFKQRAPGHGRTLAYYRAGSAASHLSPADVMEEWVASARVLHLTGITPALSDSAADAIDRAMALAREHRVTISFDPNVRTALWPDLDTCRDSLRTLMARSDIVLVGHEDAEILFPGVAGVGVLDAIRALGPRTVVLKQGAKGAMGHGDGAILSVPALPVTVVDSVGAGDGFDAGFLAGVLRGFDLGHCLDLGARVGAAAVSVAGDWEGYPRAAELDL